MAQNIILITLDSLQAEHCGFMGYERETTPTLRKMANDGLVFENAITPASQTPESMPVIFTGEFSVEANASSTLSSQGNQTRAHLEKHQTIPEMFSAKGYTTIGFSTNSYTSRYFGYDSGFDFFEDFTTQESRPGPDVRLPSAIKGLWKLVRSEEKFKAWEHYDEQVIEQVAEADQPYFLWVMLMDTHSPYIVPSDYRKWGSGLDMFRANWSYWRQNFNSIPEKHRQRLVDSYDNSILYADAFINELRDSLSETDPVFVVHGDHGEAFGEHGSYGHGVYLYEEYVKTPLLISDLGAGQSLNAPVSLRELDRILNIISNGSVSQLEQLYQDTDRHVIAEADHDDRKMVRNNRWKLILQNNDQDELYDLVHDPREQNNVMRDYSGVGNILNSLLNKHESAQLEKQLISEATIPSEAQSSI